MGFCDLFEMSATTIGSRPRERSPGILNKHNLKIQADYANIHKQKLIASTNPGHTANATDDTQFRLQAQIIF